MHAMRIIADLAVDDTAASDDFYTGFLGLQREDLGLSWVTRYVATSGAQLQALTSEATAAMNPVVSISVTDVDSACAEALERGLMIVHPLATEPWGVRRFFVQDPAGNVVNIVQHRG